MAILGVSHSRGVNFIAMMKQALSEGTKEQQARARVAAVNSNSYHMKHLPNVSDDGGGITLESSKYIIGVFEVTYKKGIEGRGWFTDRVQIIEAQEAEMLADLLATKFQSSGGEGLRPLDIARVPRLFWSIVYYQHGNEYDKSEDMLMDLMLKTMMPQLNWSHLDRGGRKRAASSKARANQIQSGTMCILDDKNEARQLEELNDVLIHCEDLAMLEEAVSRAADLSKQFEKFETGINTGLVLGIYGSLLAKLALFEARPPILDDNGDTDDADCDGIQESYESDGNADNADNLDSDVENDLDLADDIMTTAIVLLRDHTKSFIHLVGDLTHYTGLVYFFHAQLQLHRKLYGMAHESCSESLRMLCKSFQILNQNGGYNVRKSGILNLNLKEGYLYNDLRKSVKFVHHIEACDQILHFWKEVLTSNGERDLVFCDSCGGDGGDGDRELCEACEVTQHGGLLKKLDGLIKEFSETLDEEKLEEMKSMLSDRVAQASS
jgi:hypothetical protein